MKPVWPNLRQSGAKADLDVDNRHAGGTRVIEDACGTSQERVFVILRIDGNDAGLTVHAQDGGAGRIDRKCSSHDTPCDRGVPVRFYLNLPLLTFDSCLERDRGDGCPSYGQSQGKSCRQSAHNNAPALEEGHVTLPVRLGTSRKEIGPVLQQR